MLKYASIVLAALLLAIVAAPASGQVTPALSLDAFPQGRFYQSNDQFVIGLKQPLANQPDTQTSIFLWDSNGRFRFKRVKQAETIIGGLDQPALGYRILEAELNPTTGRLPSALNTVALAGAIPFGQVGPGHLTLIGGAGYAGNSPFNDDEALYGIGHILYGVPLDGDDTALILTLDYDGHNAFMPDTPLPGVAFARQGKSEKLGSARYVFGFPYTSITWTPAAFDSRITLDLRYTFPEGAVARVNVKVVDNFSVYASFTNFLEGFRIHATPRYSDDRMFLQMRRAEVGVRLIAGKLVDLSAGVGYAFDQTLSTGFDARELHDVWFMRDGAYASLFLRGGF